MSKYVNMIPQPNIPPTCEYVLNKIVEYIDGRRDHVPKVLDVGCGIKSLIGTQLRESNHVIVLHGLDIDVYALENKVVDKVYIASVENMPFDDDTYNIVFSYYLLEHIHNYQTSLKEMARVVAKDGILSLIFTNPTSPEGMVARLAPFWFHTFFRKVIQKHKAGFPTVFSYKSVANVVKHLKMNGFTEVKTAYFNETEARFQHRPILLKLAILYTRLLSIFGLDKLKSSVTIISHK